VVLLETARALIHKATGLQQLFGSGHNSKYRVGQKKKAVVLQVVTSSLMDLFKEIPLLEGLPHFQKDACMV